MNNENVIYKPRRRPASDLSHRATRTARVLTRLPDGEHVVKVLKERGTFIIEIDTGERVRKWSF